MPPTDCTTYDDDATLTSDLAKAINAYNRARSDETAGVRVAWGPVAADLRSVTERLMARIAATADYTAKIEGYTQDAAARLRSQQTRDAAMLPPVLSQRSRIAHVQPMGIPPGVPELATAADGPRAQRCELDLTGVYERVEPAAVALPPPGPNGVSLRKRQAIPIGSWVRDSTTPSGQRRYAGDGRPHEGPVETEPGDGSEGGAA